MHNISLLFYNLFFTKVNVFNAHYQIIFSAIDKQSNSNQP